MHAALTSRIESAFAGVTLPEGQSLSVEAFDDEGSEEFFRGRDWRKLGYRELKELTPCLGFFTPVAFCYFLPSFLLASLEEPESWFAGEVSSRLCPPKNDPSRASYAAWWLMLSHEQRDAAISFLWFMQSIYGAIPDADLLRLGAYREA